VNQLERPDVSIIVASYNTAQLTAECIRSVIDNTKRVSYEIIVVDDCSPDDSVGRLGAEFPDVTVLVNDANVRYAKTNNRGLSAANGRYALLLNTDTLLNGDAVSTLVEFMEATPEAAAAGPKLLNPDGSTQHCIRSFPGLGVMIAQSIGLHKLWPRNPWTERYYNTKFDYSRSQPVESIGTTAFIIRREVWERSGMLDERFSWAFCDQAYCLSLGRQGETVYYVAGAEVFHLGSQSINQNTAREIDLMHESLTRLYDIYLADRDPKWKRFLVKHGIGLRRRIKLIENRISRDKRLIKGPGAPKVDPRTLAAK
jgi:GT2 family glycosyltransferase